MNPETQGQEEASKTSSLIDQLKTKFGEFEKIKEQEQPEFASSEELTLEVSAPRADKSPLFSLPFYLMMINVAFWKFVERAGRQGVCFETSQDASPVKRVRFWAHEKGDSSS